MNKCLTRAFFVSALGVLFGAAGMVPPVSAQDAPRSAALAKELTGILQQRKLDSVAARSAVAPDQFVAALYFPGQLLLISARTSAPAVINEKLARREFRDVYIDLNSASIPDSRIMISDGGADGLRPKREVNMPFDTHDASGKAIRFDGNWREDRMSEQDYMKAFTVADEQYVAALQALLNELKKTS